MGLPPELGAVGHLVAYIAAIAVALILCNYIHPAYLIPPTLLLWVGARIWEVRSSRSKPPQSPR